MALCRVWGWILIDIYFLCISTKCTIKTSTNSVQLKGVLYFQVHIQLGIFEKFLDVCTEYKLHKKKNGHLRPNFIAHRKEGMQGEIKFIIKGTQILKLLSLTQDYQR